MRRLLALVAICSLLPFSVAPTIAARAEPPGVHGNIYVSPQYGYGLSWNSLWWVVESVSEGESDFLKLYNGVSYVLLEGYASPAVDHVACLDNYLEMRTQYDPGITSLRLAVSADGAPLTGTFGDFAWAVYEYLYAWDDGSLTAEMIYAVCHVIEPRRTSLTFSQWTRAEDYNAQIRSVDQLLSQLTLPGEAGGAVMTEEDLRALVQQAGKDVNAYWDDAFSMLGSNRPFRPPAKYVSFRSPVEACDETIEPGEVGPFYCPQDRRVYIDLLWMQDQIARFGEAAVGLVVAHEVGHHVQYILGLYVCAEPPCLDVNARSPVKMETMADCFAGAWAQDAERRGKLGDTDIEQIIADFVIVLGDDVGVDPTDPDAHGLGRLRSYWFLIGYYQGPEPCLGAGPVSDGLDLSDPTDSGGD